MHAGSNEVYLRFATLVTLTLTEHLKEQKEQAKKTMEKK